MVIFKYIFVLFNEGLLDLCLQQFCMCCLQVYNWGIFNGLIEVLIVECGFLFVGCLGLGKLILFDVMFVLLMLLVIVDFNVVVCEVECSGCDCNLVFYVCGVWVDQQDSGIGEIVIQYLCKGVIWIVLVLEYCVGDGCVVSLVCLLWIFGNGILVGDVCKYYMIVECLFDIVKDFGGFDLDLCKLKQKLFDLYYFDIFFGYVECFCDLFGIDNEMVLCLLYKMQLVKNLGDFNVFLCDFMFDMLKIFDVVECLVSDFVEFDGVYQVVVIVCCQVEILLLVCVYYNDLKEMYCCRGDDEVLKLGVDSFCESWCQVLIEVCLCEMDVCDRGLFGEEVQCCVVLDNYIECLVELELQCCQQGGECIEELECEQGCVEVECDCCQVKCEQVCQVVQQLGIELLDDVYGFVELVECVQNELQDCQCVFLVLDDVISDCLGGKCDDECCFGEVCVEFEVMQCMFFNILVLMQKLCVCLVEEIGIVEVVLFFVGELIQVCLEEQGWQGVIECVLGGFVLLLLVDDKYYNDVVEWVNCIYFGMCFIYYCVCCNDDVFVCELLVKLLLYKFELCEYVFESWLCCELGRCFDYECVDVKQLCNVDRGIICEG